MEKPSNIERHQGVENIQNLPSAETYAKELKYFPWGELIAEVEKIAIEQVPKNGKVLDVLCGPGFLLGEIKKRRPDLDCQGADLNKDFIDYAKKQYPEVNFSVENANKWEPTEQFDAVLCTGGLHHLAYELQEEFIKKLAGAVKEEGFVILADPYIDNYKDEKERMLAAAKLGYEYLTATLKNNPPEDIIDAAIQIVKNDVKKVEFKNSIKKTSVLLGRYFSGIDMHKVWPKEKSEFGDYYFILKK